MQNSLNFLKSTIQMQKLVYIIYNSRVYAFQNTLKTDLKIEIKEEIYKGTIKYE